MIKTKSAQMKVQQMAFVMVAIFIFFGMVSIIYFSIRISGIENNAEDLREQEASELVKKISSSPEFQFSSINCEGCIDLDKVWILSKRQGYIGFWNLDYLAIEKIYPEENEECKENNYPRCNLIKIINETKQFGIVSQAFVSLCRWEPSKEGYYKCEMGRILASGENI